MTEVATTALGIAHHVHSSILQQSELQCDPKTASYDIVEYRGEKNHERGLFLVAGGTQRRAKMRQQQGCPYSRRAAIVTYPNEDYKEYVDCRRNIITHRFDWLG